MCLFLAYLVIGAAWGWLCYQNIHDLLHIQYYLSSLVGFLIIEMVASWGTWLVAGLAKLCVLIAGCQPIIVTSTRTVEVQPPRSFCLLASAHLSLFHIALLTCPSQLPFSTPAEMRCLSSCYLSYHWASAWFVNRSDARCWDVNCSLELTSFLEAGIFFSTYTRC